MSKVMLHIVPVLLVLTLCLTCLVSPVSATNFESGVGNSNQCFDLLDYSTLNDSGNNYIRSPAGGVTFTYVNPFPGDLAYVDMLINFAGGVNPGHIYVSRGPQFTQYDLTLVNVSGNLWRAYGYMNDFYENLHITLANSKQSFVTVYSLKVFPVYNLKPVSVPWDFTLSTTNGKETYKLDSNGSLTFYFPAVSQELQYNGLFTANFTLTDWQKYDYLDFLFGGDIDSFTSVDARIGNTLVPFSYSLISDNEENTCRRNVSFSIDLSSINRTLTTGDLVVTVSGYYSANLLRYGHVVFARGYVDLNDLNPLLSFWYNLKDFLSDLFGKDDSSAEQALQTQEKINVSVNNQLVGAVEDWNTNIEVVEAGYDMAFSKTTPALTWLASLADGIFDGMGWFGNVYFLVGLISVIMLVLSKSGLAHKIGSISRRKGD